MRELDELSVESLESMSPDELRRVYSNLVARAAKLLSKIDNDNPKEKAAGDYLESRLEVLLPVLDEMLRKFDGRRAD